MQGMGNSFRYLCAKNYQHRTSIDTVIEKIKTVQFFASHGTLQVSKISCDFLVQTYIWSVVFYVKLFMDKQLNSQMPCKTASLAEVIKVTKSAHSHKNKWMSTVCLLQQSQDHNKKMRNVPFSSGKTTFSAVSACFSLVLSKSSMPWIVFSWLMTTTEVKN